MAEDIQVVGVKELKDNLSTYLRVVDRGGRVLITNHGRVIGELRRPTIEGHSLEARSLWAEWIAAGRVRAASRRPALRPSPIALPEGTAAALLNEDRGE